MSKRVKQYRQNRLFISNQKRFYQEINGNTAAEKLIPDAQESHDFWSEIWGKEEKHNLNADWLKDLKEAASYPQQEQVQITKEKVCAQSKKNGKLESSWARWCAGLLDKETN